MPTIMTPESPDTADAAALIAELGAYLIPLYPIEDHYGSSIEQLLEEEVAFFVIRHDGMAAGCGEIKLVGTAYGEIKRMYVRPPFRGLGLGRRMLEHLTAYALQLGVHVLRLDTGIYQPEASRLYEGSGFQRIPPFGDYQGGPFHLFSEKRPPSGDMDSGPSQRGGVRLLTYVRPHGTALRVILTRGEGGPIGGRGLRPTAGVRRGSASPLGVA